MSEKEKKAETAAETAKDEKKGRAKPKNDRPEGEAPMEAKEGSFNAGLFEIDRFQALNSSVGHHHGEMLFRRAKEDRVLIWGSALIVAVTLAGGVVFYGNTTVAWFSRLVLKLALCLGIGLIAFYASGLLESNRKKMRENMALIVKINEALGLFKGGMYDRTDEPFYPESYRVAASECEDETNSKTLFLKGMAIFAVIVVLFLV